MSKQDSLTFRVGKREARSNERTKGYRHSSVIGRCLGNRRNSLHYTIHHPSIFGAFYNHEKIFCLLILKRLFLNNVKAESFAQCRINTLCWPAHQKWGIIYWRSLQVYNGLWLSGFICNFHPAAQGMSPEHAIFSYKNSQNIWQLFGLFWNLLLFRRKQLWLHFRQPL